MIKDQGGGAMGVAMDVGAEDQVNLAGAVKGCWMTGIVFLVTALSSGMNRGKLL
jgi:hypothetical protein